VPYGESSWDGFVSDPSGNRHHGNTSILDLLEPQALELLRFPSSFTLGESKGVVSVVSWDGVLLVPLTVVGNTFEPSGHEEDLEPSGSGDHLDGIKRGSRGDVGESDTGGGGKKPSRVGGRAEDIGSGRSKVKGEMDTELLDHESNSGNHGNTAVLNLGVLEPFEGIRAGILQDGSSQRWAFVSGLNTYTEGVVEGGHLGNGGDVTGNGGRGESGGSSEHGDEGGGDLHG